MRFPLLRFFCFILLAGISSPATHAATISSLNQSSLPKQSQIIFSSSHAPQDFCQLTVYLHGHLFGTFQSDVMEMLDLTNIGEDNPQGILIVPNLMSKCRSNCRSASHYDNFSFENYLQTVVSYLQQKGYCSAGVKKIHLIGHSGAYFFFRYRISDNLIKPSCDRPDSLLGKVQSAVLIDALYYGDGNRDMKTSYQNLVNTLKRCNGDLKFAHLTRDLRSSRPYINSCELDGCRFSTEASLSQPVQMIRADSKYNQGQGHWNVVKDSLPSWLEIFNN